MSRRSTAFFKTLTALTVLVLLAGCSSLSPYSKVTKINLKLTGSEERLLAFTGPPDDPSWLSTEEAEALLASTDPNRTAGLVVSSMSD